jgi:hypothetical protein
MYRHTKIDQNVLNMFYTLFDSIYTKEQANTMYDM